jgi:hypothetical protein
MIVLYVSLLIALAVTHLLVRRRVARLERQYTRVAAEADTLLKQTGHRGGNHNRPDPFVAAKQQLDLARLAIRRDRVEARYAAWQSFSERFGGLRKRLGGYQGKLLPYLVGAFDVAGVALTLNWVGVGLADIHTALQR